jgi:hypothetical protein
MANHYQVDYHLIYEGGNKSHLSTTLLMESQSESEAIRKIRGTNNLTNNVREVRITRIQKK